MFAFAPEISAQEVRAVYEQAVDAYNNKNFDRAIELYQLILKDMPKFAPAYVGIGLAIKGKGGDNDEVIYYYRTATEVDPSFVAAYEQLGQLYYALNKFDKAEKAFVQGLKADPNSSTIKLSLGWLYLMARPKPELAIRYFKDVIAATQMPNAYFGLGMAYFANNDRVEAIEMITMLRDMNEEELAKQLEQAVRENQRIALEAPAEEPVIEEAEAEDHTEEIVREQPIQQAAAGQTPAVTPTGYKVRLRGKLSDLN